MKIAILQMAKLQKIRDRQTPKLLQANLGAFTLKSNPFLFVTIGDEAAKRVLHVLPFSNAQLQRILLHPNSVPMKRRHLLG
jgi:hypothetical protein